MLAAKIVALTHSKHQDLLSLYLLNFSLPLYVREPLLYIWICHITASLVKQWVLGSRHPEPGKCVMSWALSIMALTLPH